MPAMRAIAASQTSVVENRRWTSALHPIAAVRVIGFRQAARDPEQPSISWIKFLSETLSAI